MSRLRRPVIDLDGADDDAVPTGPCCVCGEVLRLPNLVMLPLRGPAPGKGWGCVVCGLPPDGAMAAVCTRRDCFAAIGTDGAITNVCADYVTDPRRVQRSELREAFDHDPAKHVGEVV